MRSNLASYLLGLVKRENNKTPHQRVYYTVFCFSEVLRIVCIGLPGGASGKESACQCRRHRSCGFNPWARKIPWRRKCQPTLVFLPGESHGQRSLVGYSPWGHKESDTTEWLTHTTCGSDGKASAYNAGDLGSSPGLGSSPAEGNGTLLQYSCLENPIDRGAWWATVHRVAKSRTWLSN